MEGNQNDQDFPRELPEYFGREIRNCYRILYSLLIQADKTRVYGEGVSCYGSLDKEKLLF